jgi:predicted amidohydrolase YtcJ
MKAPKLQWRVRLGEQDWKAKMVPRRLVFRVQVLAAIVVLVSCLWVAEIRAENGRADVVLYHGKIYTADPARSFQQAIAFTGNTIVAVGDDNKVKLLIGPKTKVVDLSGKLVLPGLIDTHSHPIGSAVDLGKPKGCSLADVKGEPPTIEALKPVIRECLRKEPGGRNAWLEAVQLYNYNFKATAKDLDSIEKTRPMVLEGNDGHTAWVNSHGLDLLCKTVKTVNVKVGCAYRKIACPASTGFLVEDDVGLVEDLIPELPLEKQASLTAAALKKMSANGITSLMDALVGPNEEQVWLLLYRTGRIPMRVRMALAIDEINHPYRDINDTVNQLVTASNGIKISKQGDVDPNFLRAGVVKVFADGVMEYPAQTAALLKPYLDGHGKRTKCRGKLDLNPKFPQLVRKLDAAGLTVHVHAMGDRAVRKTLDAFAAARRTNGDRDNRHQIAHLELVDPADFPRFKALGVIADFQLLWALRDQTTVEAVKPYLGPKRYRYLYPADSLLKAGATIVGGSDWSVSSYNPFCALRTAVTRTGGGKKEKPLNKDQKIPITAAVDAYTINAAFAMKQDTTTGSLEVGKRADLVILDRDIFTVDPNIIADTKVLATYLDGRRVYKAPASGQSIMQGCDE